MGTFFLGAHKQANHMHVNLAARQYEPKNVVDSTDGRAMRLGANQDRDVVCVNYLCVHEVSMRLRHT